MKRGGNVEEMWRKCGGNVEGTWRAAVGTKITCSRSTRRPHGTVLPRPPFIPLSTRLFFLSFFYLFPFPFLSFSFFFYLYPLYVALFREIPPSQIIFLYFKVSSRVYPAFEIFLLCRWHRKRIVSLQNRASLIQLESKLFFPSIRSSKFQRNFFLVTTRDNRIFDIYRDYIFKSLSLNLFADWKLNQWRLQEKIILLNAIHCNLFLFLFLFLTINDHLVVSSLWIKINVILLHSNFDEC